MEKTVSHFPIGCQNDCVKFYHIQRDMLTKSA